MMKYVNLVGYASIVAAFVVHYLIGRGQSWEPAVTFLLAGLGVIPLAHLMGEATEVLSAKAGPTWGGLLNATFGNAAELIIALIALHKGLNDIVKASLTGSILGNLLLVSGAAMVAGGWRRERQVFSRAAAETNAGLLAIAMAAMFVPAMFHLSDTPLAPETRHLYENHLSVATAVVLIIVYALSLLFTLRTHRHIMSRAPAAAAATTGPATDATARAAAGSSAVATTPSNAADGGEDDDFAIAPPGGHAPAWSVRFAVGMLLAASVGIALVAELLVGSAESVAHRFGWSEVFVGVILLAIVGNAAEHSTAVLCAIRDDMDTAMTIAFQSSLQIALFAVPFLVLVSVGMVALGMGESTRLDLMFTPIEVVAVILAVFTVIVVAINGETNWLEGAMLLALYAILGIAFFYLPGTPAGHGTGGATTLPATLPALVH